MTDFPLRRILRWCLAGLLAGLAGAAVASQEPVELRAWRGEIDLWPHVTLLSDPGHRLDVNAILMRGPEFRAPQQAPHANLGVRRDSIWLRVPVVVPDGEGGRWILDIDYPSLDVIDVHVISDGLPVQHFALGDTVPFVQRLLPVHSHAAALTLEAGMEHELLVHVRTTSSMIVPLRLVAPGAFYAGEARMQMLQGVFAGLGLCLLVYALVHALTLRSGVFLAYALSVAGTSLFFYAYHGLAPQHLWPDHVWLTLNAAPLAILMTIGGSLWFIDAALEVHALARPLAWGLRGASACALTGALLFVVDAISYVHAHLLGTTLGMVAIVLTLPAVVVRARRGDRVAWIIFVGWAAYGCSAATMAALLRGLLPFNAWTGGALQAGAAIEMLSWLLVLSLRVQQERLTASRLHVERDVLRSLAESDALTGLPNRRCLQTRLDAAMAHCAGERPTALFLLDLDGFKAVNDSLGHDAGDALLKAVAARLRQTVRISDTVARLGGDEFVVLAEGMPGDLEARQLGTKLIEACSEPFAIGPHSCCIGLTVGYALAPLDGCQANDLLRAADAAMYAGKQAGKGQLRRAEAPAARPGLAGAVSVRAVALVD